MEVKLALLEISGDELECFVYQLDLADMVTLVDWSKDSFAIYNKLKSLNNGNLRFYSLSDVSLDDVTYKKEFIFKFLEGTREQVDYVFPLLKGIRPTAPFKYKSVSGAIVSPVEVEILVGGINVEVSKYRKIYLKDPDKAKESREDFLNQAGVQHLTSPISDDVHTFRSARERRKFFEYYATSYDFFVPSESHSFSGFVKGK